MTRNDPFPAQDQTAALQKFLLRIGALSGAAIEALSWYMKGLTFETTELDGAIRFIESAHDDVLVFARSAPLLKEKEKKIENLRETLISGEHHAGWLSLALMGNQKNLGEARAKLESFRNVLKDVRDHKTVSLEKEQDFDAMRKFLKELNGTAMNSLAHLGRASAGKQ